ncbi:MAG TPA: hypothetical protein DEG17_01570 [Cyanobacteria bacterium UBA11149]|nr:hypothetical protein [Cyanobacteria bacterium UBA11367]HBE58724.1 hypothetical protein [Cyanobacteria bacterium UBA11366]HBK65867.1 hypothetical protein [Cyanobacteria bacterium UBA11166]HBR76484.1 hypothetical protein [Cyanobacteria bacterium UBA11159]HBS69269.1 hypothetical protein [Cyanobacteria bacterium UBA11153]HBW87598.1 hypothetical protein [Cyanobacteria bacterium UBA11149]HCA97384.1 hypothetical protein [Cyanobacteria bacterium UBA9226]
MVGYALSRKHLTVNPGDIISKQPQTIEEKAKQIAVDVPDITGDHIKVPTYFIVKYPNGETKALHHVRDAREISDAIRQMHFEEEEVTSGGKQIEHELNLTGLILILAFFLMTSIVLVGIF